MTFHPGLSPLTRNPELVRRLLERLEQELYGQIHIVGILEIGSYAKQEAVPQSDSDLRIYCESPQGIIWQTAGGRLSDQLSNQREEQFERFATTIGSRNRLFLNWIHVNKPLLEMLSEELGVNVEFGFADRRFCDYQLTEADTIFCPEYQYVLGSIIHFDPNDFIKDWRKQMMESIPDPVRTFLRARHLQAPPFELYEHLKPHEWDAYKIHKCLQLQWVKWAVFAIRGAITAKWYLEGKGYPYRMSEILDLIDQFLPEYAQFAREMYAWKVDEPTRIALCQRFLSEQPDVLDIFRQKTEQVENFVKAVHALQLLA